MSACKRLAFDTIDASSDWSVLAHKSTATLIGPADFLQTVVQRTNSAIVAPAVAELAEIDNRRRNAESAAAALRQEINTVADRIDTWLAV